MQTTELWKQLRYGIIELGGQVNSLKEVINNLDQEENPPSLANQHLLEVPIGFGKHKGTLWCDLPDNYLVWMTRQEEMSPNIVKLANRVLASRLEALEAAMAGSNL
jgi:uncharacterized protein (DUF3820 family)